jgi:hypothetical protein
MPHVCAEYCVGHALIGSIDTLTCIIGTLNSIIDTLTCIIDTLNSIIDTLTCIIGTLNSIIDTRRAGGRTHHVCAEYGVGRAVDDAHHVLARQRVPEPQGAAMGHGTYCWWTADAAGGRWCG